jgi:hypothetical protein
MFSASSLSPSSSTSSISSLEPSPDEFDPEQFVGSTHPPILVVGTKLDNYSGGTMDEGGLPTRIPTPRPSTISQECGAEEIFLVNI